ncbi:MAG TPA: hypothetical protein VF620_13865 [Allosphingosinicella sp.]|jgi:hypothetical protein
MDEDEIASVHEAAHAVFATFSPWTRIHGPVTLKAHGAGDIRMSTDIAAISDTIRTNSSFDRNLPRLHLIRSLLAGPVAERILVDRGLARLSKPELMEAAEGDYENIFDQLDKLEPPRRDLLAQLEREVREELERPAVWMTVERFAAVLVRRRTLSAEEAAAILKKIATDAGLLLPARKLGRNEVVFVVLAALATTGVIWSGCSARLLASVVIGACVAGFALGLAWSLRRTPAPPASRLSCRS